jgi:hypothetical protein
MSSRCNSFGAKNHHASAKVQHHGIAVSLNQNAIIEGTRRSGANFKSLLAAALEQLHGSLEPAVLQKHIVFDQSDKFVAGLQHFGQGRRSQRLDRL